MKIVVTILLLAFKSSTSVELPGTLQLFERALFSDNPVHELNELIGEKLSRQNVHSSWKRSVDDFVEDLNGQSLLGNVFDAGPRQLTVKAVFKRDVAVSERSVSSAVQSVLTNFLEIFLEPYKNSIHNVLGNASQAVLDFYITDTSSNAVLGLLTNFSNAIILRLAEFIDLSQQYVDLAFKYVIGTLTSTARRRRDIESEAYLLDASLAAVDKRREELVLSGSGRSLGSLVSSVVGTASSAVGSVVSTATSAVGGVVSAVTGGASAAVSAVGNVTSTAVSVADNVTSAAANVVSGAATGITSAVGNVVGGVTSAATSAVGSTATSLISGVKGVVSHVTTGVTSAVGNVVDGVTSAVASVLVSVATPLITSVTGAVKSEIHDVVVKIVTNKWVILFVLILLILIIF